MIQSYNTICALGHRMVADIFDGPVVIEEKVDGSQFSFQVVGHGFDDDVVFRSKGVEVHVGDAGMFSKAVEAVLAVKDKLTPGWIYRGEYLAKPKHNSLAYDRVPQNYIAIFDIETGLGTALGVAEKKMEAMRLGFDCVRHFAVANGADEARVVIEDAMKQVSFLGGNKVEGVVIKNYNRFGADKKFLVAKVVSEEFKEIHRHEWKSANPARADIVEMLIAGLKTPARWNKAIQHCRDRGQLQDAPQDIGLLLNEIKTDVLSECEQDIKDELFKHFWPQISRGIIAGFPEYYKGKLDEKFNPLNRVDDAPGTGDCLVSEKN